MAGVQQNISYKKELFAGDVIEISTQVLEVTEKRMCVRHEMRNIETRRGGRRSARSPRCTSTSSAHKSCPLPAAVRQAAEALAGGHR